MATISDKYQPPTYDINGNLEPFLTETITGTSGADTLVENYGQADDILDGGDGIDTAIFFDKQANFTVTTLGTVTQVTGNVNSGDSAKYHYSFLLLNIEKIQFSDASAYFLNPTNNNSPVGSATAVLPVNTQVVPYIIKAVDLLKGFNDLDGDPITVSDLVAKSGSVQDNGNNTWTFTPSDNVNSLITLAYNVIDGKGGSIAATQSFNLIAVNYAPTGSATKTLPVDYQTTSYIIKTSDLVAGFDDPDVEDKGKLAVIDLAADYSGPRKTDS
jgi:hypothetical protein